MKDIVDIYLETGDFLKSVELSGLSTLQAHIKLLASGVLKIQDKINYLSRSGQLGGMAEEYFQKLIPEAVNANEVIRKNNPVYDFLFGDLKIDVKYSSLLKRKSHEYWGIRVSGNHDVVVGLLERERGDELKKPHIVIIPKTFFKGKTKIEITKASQRLKDFEVSEKDLRKTLKDYDEIVSRVKKGESVYMTII